MSEDRCICCGDIVPEGRMVCPNCEKGEKPMKCNHPIWSPVCSFHYNGECLREHNYECPALAMKNLSNGEMVQIAEGKQNKTPRYIDANKLIELANHEGAYGYVDVHDIYSIPPADVVKVVRCKDCKWNGDDCSWCTKPSLVLNGEYISCLCIEPNWFCADGERKEKTDENLHRNSR